MNGCIEWTRGRTTAGYGVVRLGGRPTYAHRKAYEDAFGPIPDGLHVLHRCDNPPCINPAHLFLGTDADNVRDMLAKGRGSPPPLHVGEAHPNHRLTEDQVRAIRSDGRILGLVAADYGVSIPTIQRIRTGAGWRAVS